MVIHILRNEGTELLMRKKKCIDSLPPAPFLVCPQKLKNRTISKFRMTSGVNHEKTHDKRHFLRWLEQSLMFELRTLISHDSANVSQIHGGFLERG